MLPGPQTTVGIPAWSNRPPSVPKATVAKSSEPLSNATHRTYLAYRDREQHADAEQTSSTSNVSTFGAH